MPHLVVVVVEELRDQEIFLYSSSPNSAFAVLAEVDVVLGFLRLRRIMFFTSCIVDIPSTKAWFLGPT
jgi:hypothetical protein